MYDSKEYLTKDEIMEIQIRITDIYSEDYLTPQEYHQLFNVMADEYIHNDTLYINNI